MFQPGVTNAYKNTDDTVTVLDAQPKDENTFICIAMNEFGKDNGTLTLVVKGKATIEDKNMSDDLGFSVLE